MRQLLCFSLFVAYAAGGAVPTENKCPGTFHETRITDCTAFPCTLYKGREYTVEIDFTPFRDIESTIIKCETIYYGQKYNIPEQQACTEIIPKQTNSSSACPLTTEGYYTYVQKFSVPHFVPSTFYPIKCSLIDEQKAEHLCLAGSGRIV